MGPIGGGELLVLLVIAAVVVGPERLPTYAEQLGRLVRELRKMATGAKDRVKEELGEYGEDISLADFDPRKYDPRRIVRDALGEDLLSPDPLGLRTPSRAPGAGRPPVRTGAGAAAAAAGALTSGPALAAGFVGAHNPAATSALFGQIVAASVPFDDEAT